MTARISLGTIFAISVMVSSGLGDSRDDPLTQELRRDGVAPVVNGERNLEACLALAFQYHRKRPASRFDVAIAQAQHRQALSAYWPQVSLHGLADMRGDHLNFIYPESVFGLPDMTLALPEISLPFGGTTIQTPASTLTIPSGAFGPNFPPSDVQVPVPPQSVQIPGQTVTIPGQEFAVPGRDLTVPEQEIDLADRVTYGALLDVKWLIYDGGMRKALSEQAKKGVAAARQDARRADHEIVLEVTRMYYGAVLAGQLLNLGNETLERMEVTLSLTEQLYQNGSMQVKKTDYLRNKVIVESIRMLRERLRKNKELAQSALVHSMGLSWKSKLSPAAKSLPFQPHDGDLASAISQVLQYNPHWAKVHIGIEAADAKVRQQRSGHLPKVAFLGSAHHLENSLGTGATSDSNLQNWSVGVGVELPLFNGFRTREKVKQAQAEAQQRRAQRDLLRQGLAMKVKSLFLEIEQVERQVAISEEAVNSAKENRDLAERSYRNDLIEAREVFESQLMEAMMRARHYKLFFEQLTTIEELNSVIGNQDEVLVGGETP